MGFMGQKGLRQSVAETMLWGNAFPGSLWRAMGLFDFEVAEGGGDERGPACVGGGVDVETVFFEEGGVGFAVFGEEGWGEVDEAEAVRGGLGEIGDAAIGV
jgi:hypothetical protein